MAPRLSIIIPIFNSAASLKRCLDSVCSQTIRDIEIICVNDCSTDESINILEWYSKQDSRIRIISQSSNCGPGAARNKGISESKGDFIGFVDSDDWIDSRFFESMIMISDLYSADYVINSSITREFGDHSEAFKYYCSDIPTEGIVIDPVFCANSGYGSPCTRIISRSKIICNQLRFPESFSLHEDDFFHKTSCLCANKIILFSGPAYHYSVTYGSLMESRALKNEPYLKMFRSLKDYYSRELDNPDFGLKLFGRMLYSDISDAEYQGVKDYLSGLSEYLEKSGVWTSDFDRYAISNIIQSTCHADLMKRIGLDPWTRYHSMERIKNRMRTKVSVIIPVYNTVRYLDRCIRSVCDQTLHDIEIICVNDCSTDDSLRILRQYAHEDNRITVIDLPENKGVSNARNVGLEQARGPYVYFIDSDDWIDPGFLEQMFDAIETQKTDIVINSHFINEYEDNSRNTESDFPFISPDGSYKDATELELHYPPVIWSRLYRKSFLDKNGISFPIVKGGAEDIFFSYAADLTQGSVFAFRGYAYHYFQRSQSAMHTSNRGFHYFESFKLLYDYLYNRELPISGIKLFYVESLIIDSEEKYAFIKSFLSTIRSRIDENSSLYNEQEQFLIRIMDETADYSQFVSLYNPNIALSFIRHKMTHRV